MEVLGDRLPSQDVIYDTLPDIFNRMDSLLRSHV